jgi:hypothetical protein
MKVLYQHAEPNICTLTRCDLSAAIRILAYENYC